MAEPCADRATGDGVVACSDGDRVDADTIVEKGDATVEDADVLVLIADAHHVECLARLTIADSLVAGPAGVLRTLLRCWRRLPGLGWIPFLI